MHISFKIIKYFISLYAARHISDTIVSIIRSFLLLHMQSLVPYQITNMVFVYKSCVVMLLCTICSTSLLKFVFCGTFYTIKNV
jgi:hypothetical protein